MGHYLAHATSRHLLPQNGPPKVIEIDFRPKGQGRDKWVKVIVPSMLVSM